MKRKFDFVLSENPYYRDVFRFYPKGTHVHSHDDNPPESWDGVYKVYYSWGIIRQYLDCYGKVESEESQRLFDMFCDECSRIPELPAIIKWVMDSGESYDQPTFGQPAGDWHITKGNGRYKWSNHEYKYNEDYEYYDFQVFDNWTDQGYRFTLDKESALKFCEYLDTINNYALEHGEGI